MLEIVLVVKGWGWPLPLGNLLFLICLPFTFKGKSKILFSFSDQSVFLFKVIKLLGTEKGKKNKTNLVFLAGNRVLKSIEQSHNTEKALTSLLK